MTVVYTSEVATVTFLGFIKLLVRWRGSIYKLLWKDFLLFAGIYLVLAILYHFILPRHLKPGFESLIEYCDKFQSKIPLSFILGFYVTAVVGRWWEQFNSIPFPSRLAVMVTAHIRGQDDRSRMVRRTIIRYICLGNVMTMASISVPVKKRFPTIAHMVDAGFMLPSEQAIVDGLNTQYNKFYVPFVWAATLIAQARREGRISNDFSFQTLTDEVNSFRGKAQKLFNYDWVTIPLVYTQVATLAVYIFFIAALMGRQHIPGSKSGDLIFPMFTILQFFFYMGWLKVAEELLNPFGEDDDDFDINSLIDRNLKTGYLIVDEMHEHLPELLKDQYWDKLDIDIPYTEASLEHYKAAPLGSAEQVIIPETKIQFVPEVQSQLSLIAEEDEEKEKEPVSKEEETRRMSEKSTSSHHKVKLRHSGTEHRLSVTRWARLRDRIRQNRGAIDKMAKVRSAEDKAKSPGQSPPASRKSSMDEERESLKQAGHRDSKTETQGHEALETKDTAPIQPPEETKPSALSEAMVNEILNRLKEIRSRKSYL